MKKKVQYQTGEGVLISSTDHPDYTTRKRAAKRAKELGHSTLYEKYTVQQRRLDLSHFIQ